MTSLNDDHPGDIAHSSKSSMNVCAAVRTRVPAPSQMLGGPASTAPPLLLPLLPPLSPVPPSSLPLLPAPLLLPEPLLLPLPVLVLPLLLPLPLLPLLPLLLPLVLPVKPPPLPPLLVLPPPDPPPLGFPNEPLSGVPEQAAARNRRTSDATPEDRCDVMSMFTPRRGQDRIEDSTLRKGN
jgi:hypothetical protein